MASKTRQHNVTAAQWAANGDASGQTDLMEPGAASYGENVFSPAVQKARLPEGRLQEAPGDARQRRGARPVARRRGRRGDEGVGDREGRHALHALVPAADRPRPPRSTTRSSTRPATARAIAEFSGKELIQGEPDASSFPTGGIRATFEARGYTAWDPTSPGVHPREPERRAALHPDGVRVVDRRGARREDPAAALDGRALDGRRSARCSCSATRTPQRVFTTVGPEQEYFLIDEQYFYERPDLVTTGRTLFGAKPPKGHELDDHYFGSIPERVLAYMLEAEHELRQARRAGQDPPQRGRARPVRDRADLRELERRLRPPAADDAGAAERRPPLRPRLPAAREAVRRRQRLGQAQQLVDGHRHRAQPARPGRHAGARTCSSCSSAPP